jgi:hypothetical protein
LTSSKVRLAIAATASREGREGGKEGRKEGGKEANVSNAACL